VTWIQTRLKELEYMEKDPDGVFDEMTEEALKMFQRYNGLLQTGMADGVTMKLLETVDKKLSEFRANAYDDVYEEAEAAYDMSAGSMKVMSTMARMSTATNMNTITKVVLTSSITSMSTNILTTTSIITITQAWQRLKLSSKISIFRKM
jgi:peptidoglycan hydrolase-like protein with peptidoglycan-binding domain